MMQVQLIIAFLAQVIIANVWGSTGTTPGAVAAAAWIGMALVTICICFITQKKEE